MTSISSMKIRRVARQSLVKIHAVLQSNKSMSKEEREALKQQIQELRQIVGSTIPQVDAEEVAKRREFMASNQGLRDIFNALWMILLPYTENAVLTKDGYTKFYQALNIALVGKHTFENLVVNVDQDWANDIQLFGELNKNNFFDFLLEIIGIRAPFSRAQAY
jgi:hypothetical protein